MAAGSPPASDKATVSPMTTKSPGPARPQSATDIGRKPGRPVPGRGTVSTGGARRASGTTPTRSVSVTVQVRPAPDSGPESQPDLSFRLGQSSPNPFHTSTTITFASPIRAPARLALYDVQGKRVVTLLEQTVDPGQYVVRWNGAGDSGALLAPGVYMYRLTIGTHDAVRKVVFTH